MAATQMSTMVERVLGRYEGVRIARTSDTVVDVIVSRRYVYNAYVILVKNISAQRDEATGRIYLAGPVALKINREVEGIIASIEAKDSDTQALADLALFKDIPLVVQISAPDRHAA